MRRRMQPEDGQAMPLVAALVAMAAVFGVGLAGLAGDVVDAGRARSAADAAALAGVHGGQQAAGVMAGRNGATLIEWRHVEADVVVTVRVGDATATARATGG